MKIKSDQAAQLLAIDTKDLGRRREGLLPQPVVGQTHLWLNPQQHRVHLVVAVQQAFDDKTSFGNKGCLLAASVRRAQIAIDIQSRIVQAIDRDDARSFQGVTTELATVLNRHCTSSRTAYCGPLDQAMPVRSSLLGMTLRRAYKPRRRFSHRRGRYAVRRSAARPRQKNPPVRSSRPIGFADHGGL